MEAITISRYTNEVCVSTHLHRERRDAIPSSGQRQPFCRRSAYMTRSQRERTAVARFVLNILPIVVLDGIVREGACIGAATILQPWTLRLIINVGAPRQESTPHPPRNFSFSVLKLTDRDNLRVLL
jgi:hypothetical protein